MLLELEEQGVVIRFDKSKKGRSYKERCRRRLKSRRRSGRCSKGGWNSVVDLNERIE